MVTSHDYTSVHQDWSGDYVQKKGQALPAQEGLWSLSWTDWSGGPDLSWAVLAKLSLMLSQSVCPSRTLWEQWEAICVTDWSSSRSEGGPGCSFLPEAVSLHNKSI